jgi:hypothetical protein
MINSNDTVLLNPRIKLMNEPLKVAKVTGSLSIFRDSDAWMESIMGNVYHQLYTTSKISFRNNQAYNALVDTFNLHDLNRQDQIKLSSVKILEMRVLFNNENLQEIKEFRVFSSSFVAKGVQVELDIRVKEQCESNVLCLMYQRFFGIGRNITLTGQLVDIHRVLGLQVATEDLVFSDDYKMSNVTLNMEIDFEDPEDPKLDFYVKGFFNGEVAEGVKLRFMSKLQLYAMSNIRISGEMNDIFTNVFDLHNMVNMTQMTLNSFVDRHGQLGTVKVNGIAIFGQNCFKVPNMPDVFDNHLDEPMFTQSTELQLLSLLNKTFINDENCEMGTILMHIDLQNPKNSFFTGRV